LRGPVSRARGGSEGRGTLDERIGRKQDTAMAVCECVLFRVVSLALHHRPVALSMTASSDANGERESVPQAVLATTALRTPQTPGMAEHSLQHPIQTGARDRPRAPLIRLHCRRPNSFLLACNLREPRQACENLEVNTTRFLSALVVRVKCAELPPKKAPLPMCEPLDPVSPWRQHMRRRGATRDLAIPSAHLAPRLRSCALLQAVRAGHPSCP
jgi:hypothetical protein